MGKYAYIFIREQKVIPILYLKFFKTGIQNYGKKPLGK